MDLGKTFRQLEVGVAGGGIQVQKNMVGYNFAYADGGHYCPFWDISDRNLHVGIIGRGGGVYKRKIHGLGSLGVITVHIKYHYYF